MCTLVHLKKYPFVFVEKYIKFSTSNRSYEKECFNCNVYFESNEATQVTYVQPSQDLSYILTDCAQAVASLHLCPAHTGGPDAHHLSHFSQSSLEI
eukprot:SAG11_NODE_1486_length_4819_cov_1.894280_7_plen_96_part_00